MLAYDCVPPVEAVSAYAPQAIADYDADGFLVLESVDREQVLVDPLDFQQAYKRLESKPYAVLFASATHKQLHHYSAVHLTPSPQGRTLCLSTGKLIQPLCEPFVVAVTARFVKNRLRRSLSDVGSA